MEKLQIAIEKARASRKARHDEEALNPETHRLILPPNSDRELEESWLALPEMQLDPDLLQRNRITAFKSGTHSTYYDILRTRLRDEVKRRGIKRVAITSTRPQAGKSTTLANLMLSFSRLPQYRTMVFDFDLRRLALHKLLGQKPIADMGKLLRGETTFEEHALRYGDHVACVLSAEPVRLSSELLQSDTTQDLLNAVEANYQLDLMLFDLPPFLSTDDAHGFLSFVDGVIIVVEANNTTRSQLESVEQKLSTLTSVVGVVLNKCPYPDEDDVGAYGYEYQ